MNEIEVPLVAVLSRMELRGVRIDSALLAQMSAGCAERLEQLQLKLYECAGCEFNLNSPRQLADVLFVLLVIANEQKLDLEDALERVLEKYRTRDAKRWTPAQP